MDMTTTRTILASVAIAALVVLGGAGAESAQAAAKHYANCTALNKQYRHGVGRSGAHDHVAGKSAPVTNFYVKHVAVQRE